MIIKNISRFFILMIKINFTFVEIAVIKYVLRKNSLSINNFVKQIMLKY